MNCPCCAHTVVIDFDDCSTCGFHFNDFDVPNTPLRSDKSENFDFLDDEDPLPF